MKPSSSSQSFASITHTRITGKRVTILQFRSPQQELKIKANSHELSKPLAPSVLHECSVVKMVPYQCIASVCTVITGRMVCANEPELLHFTASLVCHNDANMRSSACSCLHTVLRFADSAHTLLASTVPAVQQPLQLIASRLGPSNATASCLALLSDLCTTDAGCGAYL